MINGFRVGNPPDARLCISHLLVADYTILFCGKD